MSDKGSLLHKPQNFNHLPNDYHNVQYLEDGTIEVTDTLSKEEYYKSLRRRCTEVNSQNARPYGLSSQLSLETSQCGTLRSGFGKRKSPLHDYKPSGTEEMCYVLMLEGVEKTYTVDKNALGIHLFEKVCKQLDLQETEYFGLTYRTSLRVDNWLKLDKRIIKQVESKSLNKCNVYIGDGDGEGLRSFYALELKKTTKINLIQLLHCLVNYAVHLLRLKQTEMSVLIILGHDKI